MKKTLRKYSRRKFDCPSYILPSLSFLKPPERISVSEWAERHRILDERSSNSPGQWHNSVTPYLVEIMDAFNDYAIEEIIFCKPTQVGGTEAMQNMLGFCVGVDPAPTLIVYPTDILGEQTFENRLKPMMLASPQLRKKYNLKNSSKSELQFSNMYVGLAGSNSPSGLASRPIRYLFLDEVDKYPGASKKEADPIRLARERTKTFRNRKIYMCSTPTLRTGHIWQEKENADVEKHYFVPCPHCGEYIELKMSQIKFPSGESGLSIADRAELATYVCQECGGIITDQNKPRMLQQGRWQVVRQTTKAVRKVAFWMNTLYSPFTRFSEIAKEFLVSKDEPDLLQNFVNSWLAEPWENTKLNVSSDIVRERQTEFAEYVLPPWTKILTAGIDVQETSLYWSIRAWGNHLTSQNIAHGQALSLTEVANIMNLEFKTQEGDPMLVCLALIDSGDQTDMVYDFASMNADWCLPCKGTSTMLSHYRISTVNKADSKAYGQKLVLVDGGKYKDMIAARMRKPNGQGSWMVHSNIDEDYAEQVTAERKVTVKGGAGKMVERWILKTSHADNHYLDTEVYAFAAADIMGVRSLFLQEQEENEEEAESKTPPPQNSSKKDSGSWLSTGGDWIGAAESNWLGNK